jgi:energy-coupling factor transporter ATP-binding protein EcfA2
MSSFSLVMPMVQAHELTKRYGRKLAVDHLLFTVQPGKVTGFFGPIGAGKSITMRLLLGLDRPDSGRATVAGRPYRELARRCMWSGRCWRPGPPTRAQRLPPPAVAGADPSGKWNVSPAERALRNTGQGFDRLISDRTRPS